MLHSEFEKLTGLQVTEEEFNAINAMYMTASSTFDKETFCKDWKKHKDSTLLSDFYNQVGRLEEQNKKLKEEIEEHEDLLATAMSNHLKMVTALRSEIAEFLIDQAENLESRALAHKAVELIGMKEFIGIKLQKGYKLYQKDKDYILEQMGVLQSIKENLNAGQAVQDVDFED